MPADRHTGQPGLGNPNLIVVSHAVCSLVLLGKGKVIPVSNLAHAMKTCGEVEVYMKALF